ncbi:hypothetical protein MATL_G00136640 [Megalops atlanticus]|uniref:Uncharacterized protein n=1 Tax=Megalops atlanticus TaxID=7932 RepID=A0A9D3T7P8_MEGAT|nr:hypothetical protein MATL_G00136640 [Megalops atlanticus]
MGAHDRLVFCSKEGKGNGHLGGRLLGSYLFRFWLVCSASDTSGGRCCGCRHFSHCEVGARPVRLPCGSKGHLFRTVTGTEKLAGLFVGWWKAASTRRAIPCVRLLSRCSLC